MSQRIFIGTATWKYEHEPQLNLDVVEESLNRLSGFFAGPLGYQRTLDEIAANPSSRELLKRLDRWFGSPQREELDWVVLYYAGHAKAGGGLDDLYLLTSDYESDYGPSTSFPANQFASFLTAQNASQENRRSKRFLLILDTCFSGASLVPLAQTLRARFSTSGEGVMFYVLASALPVEEAVAGALATALMDALQDQSLGGAHQPYILFDDLLPAINRRLKPHKAVRLALDSPDEIPQFFPNRYYRSDAILGATVQELRGAVQPGEALQHWDPKSRGVDFAAQPGNFFTGRERALGDIQNWFDNAEDSRPCIVTGSPGSGKSAILSRIVTTSDRVDCAIHAKGKTLREVVDRVAGALSSNADMASVIEALKARREPFHLILDALDESGEAERIAREFLAAASGGSEHEGIGGRAGRDVRSAGPTLDGDARRFGELYRA